jgi:transposase
MALTDAQFTWISPPFSAGKNGPGREGRARRDDRQVLEGIFWV